MNYKESTLYLKLFSDCILVHGIINSTICDLTRNTIEIIPRSYGDILDECISNSLKNVLDSYDDDTIENITGFFDFLLEKEYVHLVNNKSLFPSIIEKWESPSIVDTFIIDIKNEVHDFIKISEICDQLKCRFVQIRVYSNLIKLEDFKEIIKLFIPTSVTGIELIIKYNKSYTDHDYLKLYEENLLVSSLHIHSAPKTLSLETTFGYDGNVESIQSMLEKKIYFLKQELNDASHCGIITSKYFCVGGVHDFTRNSTSNSCLNKKLSIDVEGNFKNCPSMKLSFGKLTKDSIDKVLAAKDFKKLWTITKDEIDICKSCEFRKVCTDCRAFVEQPSDLYSKPLKCGYDPKTGRWEDWKLKKNIKQTTAYYNLDSQIL